MATVLRKLPIAERIGFRLRGLDDGLPPIEKTDLLSHKVLVMSDRIRASRADETGLRGALRPILEAIASRTLRP